ncbi:MAG: ribonuclease HII [Candidatus Enteromonas sp.]|nr:ribonuclease HII [bacterium]MDD6917056.1 ribonuclease HII [bacterium]MDY6100404.1 ribonuclease HII [Candidatus Enteromonas sp.]
MLKKEKEFYTEEVRFIVGTDEAGRGPLAGPVCAAAVLFPPEFSCEEINDSKQLTMRKRESLYRMIEENALGFGIAMVSAPDIDRLNIYEATKVAMKHAISEIRHPYQLILSDAMPLSDLPAPVVPIIKGDAQCLNIAAASILAKVTRDRYMVQLENLYPMFSFSKHKGYGTKAHLEELAKNGPIEGIHRKSFAPVAHYKDIQLKLF